MPKHQQAVNEPMVAELVNKPPIDKHLLYGDFRRGRERKQKIYEAIVNKANDLAEEDDPLKITNNISRGQSLLAVFGAVAATAVGGLLCVFTAMAMAAALVAGAAMYFDWGLPTLPPVEPAQVEIEVHSDAPPGTKFEFRVKK